MPDDVKASRADVPWAQIAATRNVIVHGYFGVSLPTLWMTIERDIPPFAAAIRTMLHDS